MILLLALFACAFALSGTAIWYSVLGLIAIFPTAPVPIAIMGTSLELSKLVVASWVYRNWNVAPKLLKYYFVCALSILMFITSIGIYGYMSKAHLDQAVPSGDVVTKVEIIDEKIKSEKDNIENARKTLAQLNTQVDSLISRTTDDKGISRSISTRSKQNTERKELQKQIQASQTELGKLNEERAPLANSLRKIEADVGPIKYIAALVYDSADSDTLEKAVRIVTLLIVAVFDPLAVLLLIAANWTQINMKTKQTKVTLTEEMPVEDKTLLGEVESAILEEAPTTPSKKVVLTETNQGTDPDQISAAWKS